MAVRKPKNAVLNDLANEILAIESKIKNLEAEVKLLEKEAEGKKAKLIEAAEKANLRMGAGELSRWDIKEEVYPQSVDWDGFCEYMAKNKYWHLVQRRPGVKACQELWERGIDIPGIDKFTKIKVNVKGV